MTKNSRVKSFQLLSENPLTGKSNLEFGHKEIIATLQKIICSDTSNLTIGLFGNWGTGKSTIVEALKMELLKDTIPLIIFDVWKHEGDALRRTFLKELDTQLSNEPFGQFYLKKTNVLDSRVYNTKSIVTEVYKFRYKKLWLHFLIIFIISLSLISPIVVFGLLFNKIFNTNVFEGISVLGISAMILAFFTSNLLIKYIDSFILPEKQEAKYDKFQDPHEFETEFANLIDNLKVDEQKIVITFDNLDRVSGENALTVISTIKTFLDYKSTSAKKVIFLIPCDIDAIKLHLKKSLKNGENSLYIDEFLRKFFNTSIWIPEFYPTELESFATKKLKETNIPEFNNEYLSWLIIIVFDQNPRQIVQFINILLSSYLLMKEFCDNGGFNDPEFYKKNVPQLAKFLLLKQRHPEIIALYKKTNTYSLSDELILTNPKVKKSFKSLLDQTVDIQIDSLEPYFKYRISKDEQKFPGTGRLLQMILTKHEDTIRYAEELKVKDNIDLFCSVVKTHLLGINNLIFKSKFIQNLLKLTRDLNIKLNNTLYKTILNECVIHFSSTISRVDPKILDDQLLSTAPYVTLQDRQKLNSHYIATLTDLKSIDTGELSIEEYENNVFAFAITNRSYILTPDLQIIQQYLETRAGKMSTAQFFEIGDIQKQFISDKYKLDTIRNCSSDNLEIANQEFELIQRFKNTERFSGQVLERLHVVLPLLLTEKLLIEDQDPKRVYDNIGDLLNIYKYDAIAEPLIQVSSAYSQLTSFLLKHITGSNLLAIETFLKLIHSLYKSKNVTHRAIEIIKNIIPDATQTSIEHIIKTFNDLFEIQELKSVLVAKAVSDFKIRNILLGKFNIEYKIAVILELINNKELKYVEELISTINSQIETEEVKPITDHLVHSLQDYCDEQNLEGCKTVMRIIDLLSERKPDLLYDSPIWGYTQEMLNSGDVTNQQIAFQLLRHNVKFLSPSDGEQLALGILEDFTSNNLNEYPIAHEALLLIIDHLDESDKDRYIDFIFNSDIPFIKSLSQLSVYDKVLDKVSFDVSNHIEAISNLLDLVETAKDEGPFYGYKKILGKIFKIMNHYKGREFTKVRQRIKSILSK